MHSTTLPLPRVSSNRMFQVEFRLSQAMANPETDRDSVLRDLSAFVSSPSSLIENSSETTPCQESNQGIQL